MKATTLSKKLTLARNLVHFLSLSVMLISFSYNASAMSHELSYNSNRPLTNDQYHTNRCDGFKSDSIQIERDFLKACGKANLGLTVKSCSKKLKTCSRKNSKKSYCLNNAISNKEAEKAEEREDKIREQINDLQADYDDEAQNALDIAKRKRKADAKLEEALSNIAQGRADALKTEIAQMDEIANSIAQQYDQIDLRQLELRKVILDNEIACRENAEKMKTAYIIERKRRAATGQGHLTQGQLFNRIGLSVNEAGTIKYNRYLKNCTALYTKNGRRTGFGSKYNFQKASIDKQKEILKREINRLAYQRTKVKNARQNTLNHLNGLQRSSVTAYLRAVQNLQNEANVSKERGSRIQANITTHTLHRNFAETGTRSALESVILATATARSKSSKNKIVASESKIDAFIEASSLRNQITNDSRNDISCNRTEELVNDANTTINNIATNDDSTNDGVNTVAVAVSNDRDEQTSTSSESKLK